MAPRNRLNLQSSQQRNRQDDLALHLTKNKKRPENHIFRPFLLAFLNRIRNTFFVCFYLLNLTIIKSCRDT